MNGTNEKILLSRHLYSHSYFLILDSAIASKCSSAFSTFYKLKAFFFIFTEETLVALSCFFFLFFTDILLSYRAICSIMWYKDESERREDKVRFSRIGRGVSRLQLSVMIASPGRVRNVLSNDSYSPTISIAGRAWTDVRDPSGSLNSYRILEFRYLYSLFLFLFVALGYSNNRRESWA